MARVEAAPVAPRALLAAPLHLSYSQTSKLAPGISQYGCPRAWAFQYRAGLPFVGSPALCTGTAIDEGISTFFRWRQAGEDVDAAADRAGTAAEEAWLRAIANANIAEPLEEEKDLAYRRAVGAGVGTFIAHHRDVIPAAVQARHEYTVRSLDGQRARMVLGFSDWIAADGVIVDNKTSGSVKWSSDGEWFPDWVAEKRVQLAGYWLARRAEEARGEPMVAPVVPVGRLVVIYVNVRLKEPQLRTLDLEFGPEDEERVLEAIRAADAMAVSGIYPAKPGAACQFCSFTEACGSAFAKHSRPFVEECGVPEQL